jgi:hypothetical protein
MTEEQVHDLWLQFGRLYPDRVKKADAAFHDPEFEAFEQELEAETRGVLYDDTRIIPYGEAAPVFLSEGPPAGEWEDV